MPAHPFDSILVDDVPPVMGDHRSFTRRYLVLSFNDAQEIRDTDLRASGAMPAQRYVRFDGRVFKYDPDDLLSVDDGYSVIVSNLMRYKLVSAGGGSSGGYYAIVPELADRDDFDDAPEDAEVLVESDSSHDFDPWVYVKNSPADADWSAGYPIRGPRGGDRYEISNWDSDRPASGEEVIAHIFTIDVTFPINFAGSRAAALAASTGAAVYSIQKNGSEVGTLTFTGSTAGVFAAASAAEFHEGDRLSVVAPNPRNASLSGVSMTLVGLR